MSAISSRPRLSAQLQSRLSATAKRAKEIESTLGERTEDQVLLKVDADLNTAELKQLAADYGATIRQNISIPEVMQESFDGQLLLLDTGINISEAQTLAALEGDSRIEMATTNDTFEMMKAPELEGRPRYQENSAPQQEGEKNELVPNDLHPEQWGLRNKDVRGGLDGADISATEAWSITTGGDNSPIIAVIDSGVDAFHEDMKANMWVNPNEIDNDKDDDLDGFVDDIHGLNSVEESGNIFDEVGHGTHVAGVIGAVGNNGKGVAGVNWDTEIMGVKISDGDRVSLVAAITGTLYATEKGARIANHSWGGPRRNPILEDVMTSSPMLHVCAAGNSQKDSDVEPFFPAGFDAPNIISVGASTKRDNALFYSNWGANTVDVHAPGAMIYSTMPVHKYDELSGTSMAAPHVTGVAGLIVSKYPDASNQEIKDRIMFGSDPIDEMKNLSVSGGRLNAHSALEEDQVAPADIQDFKITSSAADGFQLSWTGVGDDGLDGKTARYELEADFGDKKVRLHPDFPKQAGQAEAYSFKAMVEDSDRPFSVNINAVDNVGNRSAVASAKATMPAAEVPIASNFDLDDDFTTDGTWAKVEEPGRGLVYTDSPNGPHEPGSDTKLTSPVFSLKNLRSSRVTFDAKMLTNKFDFLMTEVSTDGETWKNEGVLRQDRTPGYGEWGSYSYDLSKYDGAENLQIRLRYEPSNKSKEDGVWVDNFKVLSAADN